MTAIVLHKPRRHLAIRLVVHVANATFTLLTVAVIVVGVASWSSHDGSFGLLGHKVLAVRSNSMSPTFNTGDAVVVADINDGSAVNLGDIITFRNATDSSIIITHRVVAKWSGSDGVYWFTTKGDANNAADLSPIAESNIIGVVKTSLPRAGYVLAGLRNVSILATFAVALGLAHLSLHLARSADSLELVETKNKKPTEGDMS